jgi:hypothetical protein
MCLARISRLQNDAANDTHWPRLRSALSRGFVMGGHMIRLLAFTAGVVLGVALAEWLKRGFEER